MTDHGSSFPTRRKIFTARRLTLLASVAGLGIVLTLAGPLTNHSSNLPAWTPAAHAAEGAQHPAGFANLVAKVKPAVISVRVRMDGVAQSTGLRGDQEENGVAPGSPFEHFFQQFGDNGMPNAMPQRHEVITGEGSGFFISPDGYAVTNNHVVDHAQSVKVTTDDGTTYTARVVGTDPKTDLAVIKVDGKSDFPYVKFADQAPRIGDWVVAIGNPFGLGGTVTAGIVSARGRDIGSGPYDDYIQIDAPINKGNSGGPAFDTSGNVVGVNTAIYSPSGGSVGIGFDIPADTAKMVVAQLEDKGSVTRGWMGVQIQAVTPAIADSLGLKTAKGAIVDEPQPGSPAAKGGIEAGDVITALNGAPVKDSRDLARKVALMAPGTSIKLDVLRNGANKTLNVTLGVMPDQRQAKADAVRPAGDAPHLGLSLAPAAEVAGAGENGVVITGVEPDGPAADHGLKAGDVILNVGGKAVANVGDVRKALVEAKSAGKHDVLMHVKTANAQRFVALPLGNG
ncbi:MAG TPA: Do family serine endopeptidase [Pseudolabrys sp.]|nr:Do family serine endopeptidase [Pseudolabrys sp.]